MELCRHVTFSPATPFFSATSNIRKKRIRKRGKRKRSWKGDLQLTEESLKRRKISLILNTTRTENTYCSARRRRFWIRPLSFAARSATRSNSESALSAKTLKATLIASKWGWSWRKNVITVTVNFWLLNLERRSPRLWKKKRKKLRSSARSAVKKSNNPNWRLRLESEYTTD